MVLKKRSEFRQITITQIIYTEELQWIRSTGYAIDDEELLDGLLCLAVPVLRDTRLYGTISLSAPKGRMAALPLRETVALLQQQSAQCSAQLAQGASLERKTRRSSQVA